MSSKKPKGHNQSITFGKPKIVPVAEGSLQSKTPGGGPGKLGNEQNSLVRGSRQSANMASQGGQYGGMATQQPRFSARQQAQRMQARAEEERLGEGRQSGWGGLEQSQHAGSQQSQIAEPSSPAAGHTSAHQHNASDVNQHPTDFGSKHKPGGTKSSR